MLASFRARARSRTTAPDSEADDDPCRRSILPFPSKLRASHAKLNLKPPPPPTIPYTSPVTQEDPLISEDCRERLRPEVGSQHGSVGIPAYSLNLDGPFGSEGRGGDEPGGGGKKRKVPASAVAGASDPDISDTDSPVERKASAFVTRHHEPSTIARSHMFHKLLFDRRKAQILLLQQDALELLETTSAKSKAAYKTTLIDKLSGSDLKPLWTGLETVAAGKWPWDRMAWRGKAIIDDPLITHTPNGIEASPPEAKKAVVGRWTSSTWKKSRFSVAQRPRKAIARTGWIPEGSFEVEYKSKAAQMPRLRQQLLSQLREYVQELLTVSIGPNPSAATKRTAAAHRKNFKQPPVKATPPPVAAPAAPVRTDGSASPSKSAASDASDLDNASNDAGSSGGKHKKKGKKKRSALANNSNPHHVKNYIPSRLAPPAPAPDPTMSALLSGLLFPMPNRFLNARPVGSTEGATKTGADDFICASCEYSLFFGDKESMRRAIAKRKRELRRRERVLRRARGVIEGRKPGTSGHYHGHDDEDDWCDEDDNGCTCGGAARDRELRDRARKGRIKDDVH